MGKTESRIDRTRSAEARATAIHNRQTRKLNEFYAFRTGN